LRLPAEQQPPIMLGEHDDYGVYAREMLGGAFGATPRPASPLDLCRCTAISAE
jgi:hypothetical protein